MEGGAWRGRYSILAMEPDLVWRCHGERAEESRGRAIERGEFTPLTGGALDCLRDLVAGARLDVPQGLPPMAAGVFGVIGYDMVRLIERLGPANPDPLDLPDAVMMRPQLVAIFDAIGQEIILVTTVRPSDLPAAEAYGQAEKRLARFIADLAAPLPPRRGTAARACPPFEPGATRQAYGNLVERAKTYIRAGDIFQVVPSHRFRTDFAAAPFALYRSLRRTNPSPFLFYLPLSR